MDNLKNPMSAATYIKKPTKKELMQQRVKQNEKIQICSTIYILLLCIKKHRILLYYNFFTSIYLVIAQRLYTIYKGCIQPCDS